MTPGVRTVFVVTRAGLSTSDSWAGVVTQANTQPRTDADRGEYRVPEAAFANYAAAVAEAERRERAARELLNPFTLEWGDLESLTSRSLSQLRAELNSRGLTPPAPVADPYQDERNLAQWWEDESANWTAALRAELWELFDKVRLYDVQEVPFEA
jgi:hypothetical protein